MFYNMFLDRDTARALEGYHALAILEWDVVVAHPSSFDRLYKAAFFSAEEFWVKGSTLAGKEFHDTAGVSDMWHILGHLNGNAICEPSIPLLFLTSVPSENKLQVCSNRILRPESHVTPKPPSFSFASWHSDDQLIAD